MTSATKIANLYPATLASIKVQQPKTDQQTEAWQCGCFTTRDGLSIWLCSWHDGFESGYDQALTEQ